MMKNILLLICCCFTFLLIKAQPVIGYQQVATGFSSPVDIVNAGDTRLFIVEQGGTIKIWNGTTIISTPFLNISSITNFNGEMGLLSAAFHPNYASNRYFFVYYNSANGNINIARYQTKLNNPNEADETSGVVLLSIPKPFTNHNGGKLNFGSDGLLYFGTGDGGSGGDPNNLAQNTTSLLGKMLRIDVNNFTTPPYYTIPPSNPYATDVVNKKEIFSVGLRNPWRWSFDRQTGDMWIADVGQNVWEEVHFNAANSLNNLNFGWRCYEGLAAYNTTGCGPVSNYVSPIFVYPHNTTTGGYSITGGYVYRGTEYPFLQGFYLVTDYVTKINWLIKSNGLGGWLTYQSTTIAPANIAGFGEDINANLYALGLNNGTMYKITASNPLPIKLISFTGTNYNTSHQLNWVVNGQTTGDKCIIEKSTNGSTFTVVDSMYTVVGISKYSKTIQQQNNENAYYRLLIKNVDGSSFYSSVVHLKQNKVNSAIKIDQLGNSLIISSIANIVHVYITDITGKLLFNQKGTNTNNMLIPTNSFSKGILVVHVTTTNEKQVSKILH